jgi:hypothetical protein
MGQTLTVGPQLKEHLYPYFFVPVYHIHHNIFLSKLGNPQGLDKLRLTASSSMVYKFLDSDFPIE